MIEVTVENFYDPTNGLITIPLERDLSCSNIQIISKIQQGKSQRRKARRQLLLTNDEISYLESVMQSMLKLKLAEVEEVGQELIKEGYLTSRVKRKGEKKGKKAKTKYLKFLSKAFLSWSVKTINKTTCLHLK